MKRLCIKTAIGLVCALAVLPGCCGTCTIGAILAALGLADAAGALPTN